MLRQVVEKSPADAEQSLLMYLFQSSPDWVFEDLRWDGAAAYICRKYNKRAVVAGRSVRVEDLPVPEAR